MNLLLHEIAETLKDGVSVLLVAPTDSGKTWFVKNELIPEMKKEGLAVGYLENPDAEMTSCCDFWVIDEVEILGDREFLEKLHPEEVPFYEEKYLEEVKRWHGKMKEIKKPCVYVLTRNDEKAVENLMREDLKTEWDRREVKVVRFEKEK